MRKGRVLMAACAAAIGMGAMSAQAITIEELLGTTYGHVTFNYQNYDMGTVYAGVAPGSYDLTAPANAGLNSLSAPGGVGGEDSWAIATISSIQVNGITAWTPFSGHVNSAFLGGVDGTGVGEITGMVFGEKDHAVSITPVGGDVNLNAKGSGLEFAFAFDATPDFLTGGLTRDWATRGSLTSFPGVLDPAGVIDDGTVIFTGKAKPGIITGDALTDFVSNVNLDGTTLIAKTGSGDAIGDFTTVSGGLTGSLNNWFAQDSVPPFAVGTPPDHEWELHFTVNGPPNKSTVENGAQWIAGSNDPLKTAYVPSPTAAASGLVMLGALAAAQIRRRRQSL